jgi:hypothetical protein
MTRDPHLTDPTFAFVGGSCCPTLDFVIAFWITIAFYTLLTSLFCILDTDFLERSNHYLFQCLNVTSTNGS